MLLTLAVWERIREQFSEEEKYKLNCAITGETICPRGCILDDQELGADLAGKLRSLKEAAA